MTFVQHRYDAEARRRTLNFAIIVAVLMWAAAVMVVAAPATATAREVPPLIPGDTLNVTFLEHPELSGEFVVAGDGTLSFPSGERVVVAGFSPIDAEQQVRDGLARGPLRNPTVSLSVVKRVPVAVLGDVKTPGEYDYLPGMRVVRAIAVAGGYGARFNSAEARNDFMAREYANSAEIVTRINALKATLARITAELEGNDFIAPEGASDSTFVRAEQEIAELRRSELDAQRAELLAQMGPISERIKLLESTIGLQEEQYESFSALVADREALAKKGLATSNALVELQISRSRINTDLLQSRAALANAQQDRTRLQQQLNTLDAQLRRQLSETRRDALEELAILYERFRFTSLSVGEGVMSPGGESSLGGTPLVSHIITIVREDENGPTEFAAGEKTALLPGDIVRVRSVLLEGSLESSFTQREVGLAARAQ